jgi:hypothetical protein
MMNKRVEETLVWYGVMIKALEAMGCEVYVTGSALVPGEQPNDLDIVVECPEDMDRLMFEGIVAPGFKNIDGEAKDYERDAEVIPPEDHESDHGIYAAPAYAPHILPTQLLVFTKGSVAAGHWRTATAMLRENPMAYLTREARVRMFRTVRGQPVEHN